MPIDFKLPADPPARVQAPSAPSFDDRYARARALANGGQPERWGGRIGATFSRSASGAGGKERGLSFALYRRW